MISRLASSPGPWSMTVGMLLLISVWLFAAPASAKESVRPLFQSDAVLEVTLQAPWADLRKKAKAQHRHVAVLSYTDAQGKAQRIEATVEARGLTRLRYCHFAPLRLRFAKGATKGTIFAGQRSLKMVTHCRSGQQFEQYVIQELLAYRIYNRLTEPSFRARPLDISYVDTQGGKVNGPRFAFLIEDADDMAKRNGLKREAAAQFKTSDFDAVAISRLMMFQYLIGNTDFAVLSGPNNDECCHNTRVFGTGDSQRRIAVPYDFDSAGFVDASYAAPHESLPIKKVTQRLYRGFCRHNDALAAVRQEFLGHRQAIFAMIENESRLNTRRQRELKRFVEAFYTTLNSEYAFTSEFSGKCRK